MATNRLKIPIQKKFDYIKKHKQDVQWLISRNDYTSDEAKRILSKIRKAFDYSNKTCSCDIVSSFRKAYRLWEEHHS